MPTKHEEGIGQEPDTPPSNYNDLSHPLEQLPKSQPSQQQNVPPTGEASQPYVAQTYPQAKMGQHMDQEPIPMTRVPIGTLPMASVGQPTTVQMVIQSESKSTKRLNMAAAILSAILLGLTICGLIIPPVFEDDNDSIYTLSIIGTIGGVLFMIGMTMTCVAAFRKDNTYKRLILIVAVVTYSLSVGLLVVWAGLSYDHRPLMLLFLVVAFGSFTLVIISGISCSRYNDNITYGMKEVIDEIFP